ncbi:hypothetical protein [Paraferrimonas sp. SM1919]|uniref:hypothetical protein n=1 Tax=Paraferrimonas sp. SM1919 TaxID=2662263 RepID=UPI00196A07B1|nr:hypothetical protein [Paraferrimonas sp. SM1919]
MNSQALSMAEEVVASSTNKVVSPTLSFNQLSQGMPYWLMGLLTLICGWVTLIGFPSAAALFFTIPAVIVALLAYKTWLYQRQDDALKEQINPQKLINPKIQETPELQLASASLSETQQNQLSQSKVITGYALLLCGLLSGITAVLAVVWALLNIINANAEDKKHYLNIISTFALSSVAIVFGYMTLSLLVGYVIIAASLAWAIYRLTVGLTSILES